MAEVDVPPPEPNRQQRRAQAAKNRKANRKMVKRIEAAAKRKFDRTLAAIKQQQELAAKQGADDYAFG